MTMQIAVLTSEILGMVSLMERLDERLSSEARITTVIVSRRRRPWPWIFAKLQKAGLRYVLFLAVLGPGNRFVRWCLSRWRRESRCAPNLWEFCRRQGIDYVEVRSPDDENIVQVLKSVDLAISMLFDQLLPPPALEAPRIGCVNVHNSLLPLYAGCMPTVWALADRQAKVGITMHWMDTSFDSGPILTQRELPTRGFRSVLEIEEMLLRMGVEELGKLVTKVRQAAPARLRSYPQDLSGRSYTSHPDRKTLARMRDNGWCLARLRQVLALMTR